MKKAVIFSQAVPLVICCANLGRHDLRLCDRLRRTMAWILLLIWRPSSRDAVQGLQCISENYCWYKNPITENFPLLLVLDPTERPNALRFARTVATQSQDELPSQDEKPTAQDPLEEISWRPPNT